MESAAAAEKQPHSPTKTMAWLFGAASFDVLLGEREQPSTQEQAKMILSRR
jgi:hypothetical protein